MMMSVAVAINLSSVVSGPEKVIADGFSEMLHIQMSSPRSGRATVYAFITLYPSQDHPPEPSPEKVRLLRSRNSNPTLYQRIPNLIFSIDGFR